MQAGQAVRIPPLRLDEPRPRSTDRSADDETSAFLKSITLFEDADVLVLNKPMGLAVQGGSGTDRHLDGLLEAMRDQNERASAPGAPARQGYRRLPAGRQDALCRRRARQDVSARARRARSTGRWSWACRSRKQGRISTYLAKDEREDESIMRIASHGEEAPAMR